MESKRKGIATILGTIIFIGILFTSVIPMYLSMKNVDTYYIQKKDALEKNDQQRSREQAQVYMYPTGDEAPENVTIVLENTGPEDLRVVRLWINDQYYNLTSSQNSVLKPYETKILTSIDVNPEEGVTYNAYATSNRGNVFTNDGASATYVNINGTGGWMIDEYLLNVLINYRGNGQTGTYQVDVYRKPWSQSWYPSIPILSSQPNHNGGSTLTVFKIEKANYDYKVTIKKGSTRFMDIERTTYPGINIYWIVTPTS